MSDSDDNSQTNTNKLNLDEDAKLLFRDKVAKRLINDMIRSVKITHEKGWRLLIVDSITVKIIGANVKMNDLCEERVFLVEQIDIGRRPIKEVDAIYFLSPTKESVEYLLKDFEDPHNPQYSPAHVFFTGRVQNTYFKKIKDSAIVKHLRHFCELNMDFIAYESQVFHFNSPDSLGVLFSPDLTGSATNEEHEIAEKLLSVCATLDEFPAIRYQQSAHCSKIATLLEERLEALKNSSIEFSRHSEAKKDVAVLVILDRSYDPLTPLLHEFTYQAMAYDLISLPGDHYTYKSQTIGGDSRQKTVLLSENDAIWRNCRHMHIADINTYLDTNYKSFVAENQSRKPKKEQAELSMKDMGGMMKALPQFQETIAKFALHIELAHECTSLFKKNQLKAIGGSEQDMATGEDPEGKPVKNPIAGLTPLLSDPEISSLDKVRMLMIYLITQEGIKESNRSKLFELGNISPSDQNAIANLKYLGVTLEKGSKKTSKKNNEKNSEYNLSRYTCPIKTFVSDLMVGKVSTKEFPYVKKEDEKRVATSKSEEKEGKSMRKQTKPKWSKKDKKEDTNNNNSKPQDFSGGKVIIFVAGGISYSEMRVAYEITKKFNRQVIIGGTSILTPSSYVDTIRGLRTSGNVG